MKRALLLVFFCFSLLGCGATLCTKGKSKQGLFFDFDPVLKTVDIGGYPTFTSKADFVKKLIVKWDGFLLVYSQKTVHCDNLAEIKKNPTLACKGHKLMDNYYVLRYTGDTGYEEWSYMPQREWKDIKELSHSFNKKPDYHYTNCRYKFFGALYMLWQIIKGV